MKTFKVGRSAKCPPDMGEPGYSGTVTWIGSEECVNKDGDRYHWVEVQHRDGSKTVWPSHRLG